MSLNETRPIAPHLHPVETGNYRVATYIPHISGGINS
jgi:hypothetical protein